jgi:hypothetical protein
MLRGLHNTIRFLDELTPIGLIVVLVFPIVAVMGIIIAATRALLKKGISSNG